MTKDFRNVGRIATPPATGTASPPTLPAAQARPVILGALYAAAIGFFLAGLWLVTGGASPFPREISRFLGFAFIIAAVSDVIAARILKLVWKKRDAAPG